MLQPKIVIVDLAQKDKCIKARMLTQKNQHLISFKSHLSLILLAF